VTKPLRYLIETLHWAKNTYDTHFVMKVRQTPAAMCQLLQLQNLPHFQEVTRLPQTAAEGCAEAAPLLLLPSPLLARQRTPHCLFLRLGKRARKVDFESYFEVAVVARPFADGHALPANDLHAVWTHNLRRHQCTIMPCLRQSMQSNMEPHQEMPRNSSNPRMHMLPQGLSS